MSETAREGSHLMFVFGSGVLAGVSRDGARAINFGLAQEISLNIVEHLGGGGGQNDFPLTIGQGACKMIGNAKLARISGKEFRELFPGVIETDEAAPSAGTVSFSATLSDPTIGKPFSMLLYRCVAERAAFGSKLEDDFMLPGLKFHCVANDKLQVCRLDENLDRSLW